MAFMEATQAFSLRINCATKIISNRTKLPKLATLFSKMHYREDRGSAIIIVITPINLGQVMHQLYLANIQYSNAIWCNDSHLPMITLEKWYLEFRGLLKSN